MKNYLILPLVLMLAGCGDEETQAPPEPTCPSTGEPKDGACPTPSRLLVTIGPEVDRSMLELDATACGTLSVPQVLLTTVEGQLQITGGLISSPCTPLDGDANRLNTTCTNEIFTDFIPWNVFINFTADWETGIGWMGLGIELYQDGEGTPLLAGCWMTHDITVQMGW